MNSQLVFQWVISNWSTWVRSAQSVPIPSTQVPVGSLFNLYHKVRSIFIKDRRNSAQKSSVVT